jgi:DNA replication factor GINS
MNLDELRSVQNRERQTDSLQHLRDSFYEEVADQSDDPWSDPEIQQLTDEIDTAEEVAESVYERRMGKLVKDASLAAAGYATDTEGLTLEEERLFEDLVARIETNKASVLDVLAGETLGETAPSVPAETSADTAAPDDGTPVEPTPESTTRTDDRTANQSDPEPAATPPESREATATAADETGQDSIGAAAAMDPESEPAVSEPPAAPPAEDPADANADSTGTSDPLVDETATRTDPHADVEPGAADLPAESERPDRTTVRITSDIGEILGIDDHEYHLTADDVVTLPAENATPLIERDAAEPLE